MIGARDMRWLPGGTFRMGSDRHYPEEAPVISVHVAPFWIDVTPVTNAEFARFVAATGYVTTAETAPRAEDYPHADPCMLRAGSAVFQMTVGAVPLDDPGRWWVYVFDASWRRPLGGDEPVTHEDLPDHPVVHVTYADAEAYAAWAGKRLPTEAEWEFAARGGLDGADYAWGETFEPGGEPQANYWQGRFPFENLETDGWLRTSPVRAFPPNGYGLFDMIGNVWELTSDGYAASHARPSGCCGPADPRESGRREAAERLAASKVMKGGSYLCAETYCRRYRPAARYPQAIDTSTGHVGFRCAASSSAVPA